MQGTSIEIYDTIAAIAALMGIGLAGLLSVGIAVQIYRHSRRIYGRLRERYLVRFPDRAMAGSRGRPRVLRPSSQPPHAKTSASDTLAESGIGSTQRKVATHAEASEDR